LKKGIENIVPIIFFLLSFCGITLAITIGVSGNWSKTIDSSDLQSGAGSDLNDTYTSSTDTVTVDISGTVGDWQLDVKKIDSNWDAGLVLYVKRTTDGTGFGSISQGTTYQQVTDIDQNFFNGTDDRSNIKVQLQLTGVSIQIQPDIYTTAVYYTVSDI